MTQSAQAAMAVGTICNGIVDCAIHPSGCFQRPCDTVAIWLCKCGVRIKTIAGIDRNEPNAIVVAVCPNCGEHHIVHARGIVSIQIEKMTDCVVAQPQYEGVRNCQLLSRK
jgi:hypothetical protein